MRRITALAICLLFAAYIAVIVNAGAIEKAWLQKVLCFSLKNAENITAEYRYGESDTEVIVYAEINGNPGYIKEYHKSEAAELCLSKAIIERYGFTDDCERGCSFASMRRLFVESDYQIDYYIQDNKVLIVAFLPFRIWEMELLL